MDPRKIIDERPMSARQIAAVAVMVGLNALDGFDVLSISFASPGIAKEWGIDRAALGIVLSMELIGMAIGSVFLGRIADRIGRRPTIMSCLLVMAFGMWMASTTHDVTTLSIWRVLTGMGIGGMLAAIAAATAEVSNHKRRNLAMAIMTIGYPLGAVIGGSIASMLLKGGDWRVVFHFGAFATLAFLPLVWFLVPESIAFLVEKRGPNALERVNAILARFRQPTVDALPASTTSEPKVALGELFKGQLLATTILVTLAYFMHITTFYFILKWIPKIVVDMGYEPSSAAGVLVWANVGGALGGAIFGFLSQRIALKTLTIFVLLASTIMVTWFGQGQATIGHLALMAASAGFFTNSGVVGLYSIFAHAFPTRLRATGTGFALGVGRGGSALAPMLAGFLFTAGFGQALVAAVMGAGSLVGAAALWRLKLNDPTHKRA